MQIHRRSFVKAAIGSSALALTGVRCASVEAAEAASPRSPNEPVGIGAIGLRYQGSAITEKALPYGWLVASDDSAYLLAEKEL